jgi:NADH dehydrogenase [ubiquinone] 1 alpha subcomplex assembly factor 7
MTRNIVAIAVALAFSTVAFAQDKKAAEPAKPSTMEKVKDAGAKNTAATNEAKAKKKADADARAAAQKEARDKKAAERKAKKEAKAKAKAEAAAAPKK